MSNRRRKYSRKPGSFRPDRWTENIALKLTRARFDKIDGLLVEIGSLWGDIDGFIERQVDEIRASIAREAQLIYDGHAELAEQRRLDREAIS